MGEEPGGTYMWGSILTSTRGSGAMSITVLTCMVLVACQGSEGADGKAAPPDASGPQAVTPAPQAVAPIAEGGSPAPGDTAFHAVDRALADVAVGGPVGARISALMDQEAVAQASVLSGLQVVRLSEGIKVTVNARVLFDPDSDRLTPAGMDYLTRIAQRLIAFEGGDILVVGHTLGLASEAENLSRSERWALAAVEYLASEGVARIRLSHLGRGDSEPVQLEDRDSEGARGVNERVEIAIFAGKQMKAQALPEARAGP
jgi:outer membrane protein OmpA-like peptidoglycan-associated protein